MFVDCIGEGAFTCARTGYHTKPNFQFYPEEEVCFTYPEFTIHREMIILT